MIMMFSHVFPHNKARTQDRSWRRTFKLQLCYKIITYPLFRWYTYVLPRISLGKATRSSTHVVHKHFSSDITFQMNGSEVLWAFLHKYIYDIHCILYGITLTLEGILSDTQCNGTLLLFRSQTQFVCTASLMLTQVCICQTHGLPRSFVFQKRSNSRST